MRKAALATAQPAGVRYERRDVREFFGPKPRAGRKNPEQDDRPVTTPSSGRASAARRARLAGRKL